MRYLGVDYGSKKIGLALSDEAGTMGFPHAIWTNSHDLPGKLVDLIRAQNVGAVVIGESRDLAGGDNPIAADAHRLGDLVAKLLQIPVHYEMEVFTSVEARRQHDRSEKSRKPANHDAIDDSAAALILTSYLSHSHV
jgi:putative Holliday junction resolvase